MIEMAHTSALLMLSSRSYSRKTRVWRCHNIVPRTFILTYFPSPPPDLLELESFPQISWLAALQLDSITHSNRNHSLPYWQRYIWSGWIGAGGCWPAQIWPHQQAHQVIYFLLTCMQDDKIFHGLSAKNCGKSFPPFKEQNGMPMPKLEAAADHHLTNNYHS